MTFVVWSVHPINLFEPILLYILDYKYRINLNAIVVDHSRTHVYFKAVIATTTKQTHYFRIELFMLSVVVIAK